MRPPRLLSTVLKLLLAVGLIAWMMQGGKLDAGQVAGAVRHWGHTTALAFIFIVTIAVTAWRWELLLKAQGVRIGLRDAFSLTMIGLLFNTVIPGSVGGDVIKGYYIADCAPSRKPEALATVLVDRILGLLSLLTVASAATLFNRDLLAGHTAVGALARFALIATTAGAAVLALAVFASSFTSEALGRLSRRLPLSRWASRCAGVLLPYRDRPATLLLAYAIGLPCHILACLGFYLAARAVGGSDVPTNYFLLLVPLGLLTTAIPLTPAGIGIGQAAFYTLFQLARPDLGALGANACTVYQFVLVLVYLSGLYFYVGHRAKAAGESVPPVRTGARGVWGGKRVIPTRAGGTAALAALLALSCGRKPAPQPSDILTGDFRIRLGSGWHDLEAQAGAQFRWARSDAEILASALGERARVLLVEAEPGPGVGSKPFVLKLVDPAGAELQRFTVEGRQTVLLSMPTNAPGTYRLRAEGGGRPALNDPRILDFRVFRIAPAPAGARADILESPGTLRLAEGWYEREEWEGQVFRWVNNDAAFVAQAARSGDQKLRIEVEPGPGVGPAPFVLQVLDREGRQVDAAEVRTRQTVQLFLPLAAGQESVFVLHVSGGGKRVATDPRILNFRVFKLGLLE